MPGKCNGLPGLVCTVGVLLVSLVLWGQGCEKQQTGEPGEQLGASAAPTQEVNLSSPNTLGLMRIPTLIIDKDGKDLRRSVGLQSETTHIAALERGIAPEVGGGVCRSTSTVARTVVR